MLAMWLPTKTPAKAMILVTVIIAMAVLGKLGLVVVARSSLVKCRSCLQAWITGFA